MNEQLKNAFTRLINKHHAAVQTEGRLDTLDNDDDKWVILERKSRQFWAEYQAAEVEFKALLERCVLSEPVVATDEKIRDLNAEIEAARSKKR
jgi:hypothetical protein